MYLSMLSFAILLFFAATGLTLNHQSALTGVAAPKHLTGTLNPQWVKAPEVHEVEIVDAFRSHHRIRAQLSDFRADEGSLQISFKGPGYSADAFVDRRTGAYELNENRLGFIAVINDLHKGRDAGRVWAAIIDISAILMVVVSLTGLALVLFLNKKLRSAVIALAIGTGLFLVVYLVWIP